MAEKETKKDRSIKRNIIIKETSEKTMKIIFEIEIEVNKDETMKQLRLKIFNCIEQERNSAKTIYKTTIITFAEEIYKIN